MSMCNSKCHSVDFFHLKKSFMLTNEIVLAISGHDTLRPLDIYFRPWQIVHMTLNTTSGVLRYRLFFHSCAAIQFFTSLNAVGFTHATLYPVNHPVHMPENKQIFLFGMPYRGSNCGRQMKRAMLWWVSNREICKLTLKGKILKGHLGSSNCEIRCLFTG